MKVTTGEEKTFQEENCELEIDFFRSQEEKEVAWSMMNAEIESGLSWLFEEDFTDVHPFLAISCPTLPLWQE